MWKLSSMDSILFGCQYASSQLLQNINVIFETMLSAAVILKMLYKLPWDMKCYFSQTFHSNLMSYERTFQIDYYGSKYLFCR